jgi:ATP-dependent DNA helicase DinG
LEINRGRDAELDLMIARVSGLRQALGGWRRAAAATVDDDSGSDTEPSSAPSVRWISVSTHGAQFNETPLTAGQALARARETQPQAWILTSATLTAATRFDHYLAEVGIQGATTARWNSPFDFARQALLYLPESLPAPYDARFADSVAEAAWPLIRANGGRAFILCTPLRAVDKVADRLRQLMARDDQPLPLLIQGTTTRRALIDAFRRTGNAVLVGSISFWEGIDIRGDALSLVVIDKLPFAPPDDPVVEAKIRHLRRIGRNPFNGYQLPEAIMLIKQGVGRLIRDETDRGVLMILDERLMSKPYGRTVLSSLPPFARTRSEQEAIEFLTRRRT